MKTPRRAQARPCAAHVPECVAVGVLLLQLRAHADACKQTRAHARQILAHACQMFALVHLHMGSCSCALYLWAKTHKHRCLTARFYGCASVHTCINPELHEIAFSCACCDYKTGGTHGRTVRSWHKSRARSSSKLFAFLGRRQAQRLKSNEGVTTTWHRGSRLRAQGQHSPSSVTFLFERPLP